MRSFSVVLAVPILAGCIMAHVTSLEVGQSGREEGSVSYVRDGFGDIVIARRREAMREAKLACGGPFEILREWDNVNGGNIHNIDFACGVARSDREVAEGEARLRKPVVREAKSPGCTAAAIEELRAAKVGEEAIKAACSP